MTSAARPTFLPAMGGYSLRDTGAGPISLKSSKDLNAHLKLKKRQGAPAKSRNELMDILRQKELEYQKTAGGTKAISDKVEELSDESEEEEDSESDDDEAELMLELEKIRRERLEEREKTKSIEREKEDKELEEKARSGNPLMADGPETTIKRRWDDDVIFKNQSRTQVEPKKRFINDMLRSDFHRQFMNKYMK